MRLQSLVGRLARHRVGLFAFAFALLGAGMALTELPRFTGSLRGFDLRDDPFYATRLYADSLFGGGATVYVSLTPTSPDLGEVLTGLQQLEARIAASYPDASIVSLSRYYRLIYAPAYRSASLRHFLDSAAEVPLLRDLVAKDRSSFLLLVRLPPETQLEAGEFARAIAGDYAGIAAPEALSMFHIEESIRQHVTKDFVTLTLSVCVLFLLLFAYLYRRPGAVLFAATNMLVAVLASLFFLSLLQVDLNLVTILVLPVVIVLSLADSVHLLTGYATSAVENREERLQHVLSLYLIPSFYSSLTTAVAFFTFYLYSDAEFIRDFGLVAACALMAEFFATFMVSPLLLHAIDLRKLHGSRVTALSDFLQARQAAFSVFFLAVLFGSAFFIPRLEFNTSSHMFFPRQSEVERAHNRFNEQYYSQINLEILVRGREPAAGWAGGAGFDAYVQELSAALVAEPGVTSVTSALDRITVPAIVPITVTAGRFFGSGNPYYSETANVHRIVLTFPDADMIKPFYLDAFSRLGRDAPEHLELVATSPVLVMDSVNEHVATSLVKSLLTAGVAIVLMILVMTRSVVLALLCLLPNLVPLGIVALVFVGFGFDINILTAMTAVVCLGLLDDDTIHILYRKVALQRPLAEVAFSIVSTSTILVIGFAIFCLSSFRPVQAFGTISALVFLFGVASDLTLMPAVINKWFELKGSRKRYGTAWQTG
jgi:uncharacterized protein